MADTLDLLSPTEASAALNTPSDSTELARIVTAVSRRLDTLCGPIVKRSVGPELHDGTTSLIILREPPVWTGASAVMTVAEWDGSTSHMIVAEVQGTPTAYDYQLDPTAGFLYRRSGGWDTRWTVGRRNISVTYTAGRYADTASVDPLFKQAAMLMLQHVYNNTGSRNASQVGQPIGDGFSFVSTISFALPNAVTDLLAGQLRAPAIA